jgi:hypothetical protein
MRRLLVIASLVAASGVAASQAVAGPSTVAVSATFAEPLVPALNSGCLPSPSYGVCGSGQVIPFGQATENVVFGGACGGNCDSRTINLAAGSIYADEYFSNPTCPGICAGRGPNGGPAFGDLTDVIVGGTGMFLGASGTLAGSVTGAGLTGVAKLTGTITLTG